MRRGEQLCNLMEPLWGCFLFTILETAAESAYKCGVQICFSVVLLLVGLNKP